METKYTIRITQDVDAESPRKDENVGTMICFHKRYALGDANHGYDPSNYRGWAEMEKAIRAREDVAVILPIYMYDHSGITISTTPFQCQWDSGQIGFIFVSKENAREFMCTRRLSKEVLANVKVALTNEVEAYDQYLRGDVYGYIVEDEDGEHVDSQWGLYGMDYCTHQACRALFHAKAGTSDAVEMN